MRHLESFGFPFVFYFHFGSLGGFTLLPEPSVRHLESSGTTFCILHFFTRCDVPCPLGGFAGSAPYDVHAPPKKFGPYVLYFISIFDFGSQGGLTALLPMMSMRHLKSACRASCTLHPFWIPGALCAL